MQPHVYLAGPDVFRENRIEHFEEIKRMCKKYYCIAHAPIDDNINTNESIFKYNRDLIDRCDVILANLDMFRGACVDDGTSWEIGYGFAKGKICYGYINCDDELIARKKERINMYDKDKYPIINEAEHPVNLMLMESIRLSGGKICNNIEECLGEINKKYFDGL